MGRLPWRRCLRTGHPSPSATPQPTPHSWWRARGGSREEWFAHSPAERHARERPKHKGSVASATGTRRRRPHGRRIHSATGTHRRRPWDYKGGRDTSPIGLEERGGPEGRSASREWEGRGGQGEERSTELLEFVGPAAAHSRAARPRSHMASRGPRPGPRLLARTCRGARCPAGQPHSKAPVSAFLAKTARPQPHAQ